MKLKLKRGSRGVAVLDAPEETYAPELNHPETEVSASPATWEPAPAGAFQRARERAAAGYDASPEDEPYVPKRGGAAKFSLRGSVPKSVAGRLVLGSAVFLVLGAGAVAVAAVRHSLLRDDRFAIATSSSIEISGNEHLTRAQLLSVFGADLERNIFKVPLAQRELDLERLPWVEHATVMRLLPNRLRIAVTERTPVAFVRQGTQIGLVDASGVLLDMPQDSAGDPHYSFPVLTGLNPADPPSTRAARMQVYAKFMKELGGDSADGRKRTETLSEVDVSNPEDVKALVAMNGSDVIVHFGDEQFLERYNEFADHLAEWRSQYPKLSSADMRYERQAVLEMGTGGGASQAAAGSTSVANANSSAPVAALASTPAAAPATPAPVAATPVKKTVRPVAHGAKSPARVLKAGPKSAEARKVMAQKLARARAAAHGHSVSQRQVSQ